MVKVIGNKNVASKYRCQFILRATNETACLIQGFVVGNYEENYETIFNDEEYLKLGETALRSYCEFDKLNLTVTLSTV